MKGVKTVNDFEHDLNNKIAIGTMDTSLEAMQALKDRLETKKLETFSADMKTIREAVRNALDEESLLEMETEEVDPTLPEDYTIGELIFAYNNKALVTKRYLEQFKERFVSAVATHKSDTIGLVTKIVNEEVSRYISEVE